MAISTLILAGSRGPADPLCAIAGVDVKGHIKIAGRSMIARVLDAVAASRLDGPVAISGADPRPPLAEDEDWPQLRPASCEAGPAASVAAAVGADVEPPVLVTTSDHPLLSAEMIDHFIAASLDSGADFTVGLAERHVIEAAYPGVRRTYLKLGGRELSGCNLFFIANQAGLNAVRFWTRAESDRKRPWRIAWRFGPVSAARILSGGMDMDGIFALASKRVGARVRPVLMPFADAAVDVDKPADLELVTSVIAGRGA